MPVGEALLLCILFTLVIVAILSEVLQRAGGRSQESPGQFKLRLAGGGVMLLLVVMMTFGALFVRPEDGRSFGWFWTCCSILLMGVLIILHEDMSWTRRRIRREVERVRDENLRDLARVLHEHPPVDKPPAGKH
jgi:Na+/melibiose symporter-like transporter